MKKNLNNLLKKGVFDTTYTDYLSKNSYANIFNVVNRGKNSYYNLCKGIRFDNISKIDESKYNTYVIQENDAWTTISFKFYQTVELWWLICKFNNIKNPFTELEPGKPILIPKDEIKDAVLSIIKTY